MERNRLIIAAVVVAALGLAVYLMYGRKTDDSAERMTDPWRRVERAQVTKVVIARPGSEPAVELEKRGEHWFMNRPGQGPADEAGVNDLLDQLSEMHVQSVAARAAESHADMEVDAAHAVHLTVFRGASQVMDVFVGKNLDGGTAVRAASTGPTVFRVDRSIRTSLTKEPREWRDRNVTHLERDHVRSVEWTTTHGTYRFDRNGETWTGATTNPAIARLDTARVNQVVTNLLELRATDFAAAGASTGISATSPRVTINVDNGPPVVLKLGSNAGEGEVYVQRDGSDIVYTIGRSHGPEIDLDVSSIQAPPPAPDAGPSDASAAGAAPAGGAGAGPMGDGGIPPEVMEQIRRQMQQRGMNMPH
jgi:hypothetical protein